MGSLINNRNDINQFNWYSIKKRNRIFHSTFSVLIITILIVSKHPINVYTLLLVTGVNRRNPNMSQPPPQIHNDINPTLATELNRLRNSNRHLQQSQGPPPLPSKQNNNNSKQFSNQNGFQRTFNNRKRTHSKPRADNRCRTDPVNHQQR